MQSLSIGGILVNPVSAAVAVVSAAVAVVSVAVAVAAVAAAAVAVGVTVLLLSFFAIESTPSFLVLFHSLFLSPVLFLLVPVTAAVLLEI